MPRMRVTTFPIRRLLACAAVAAALTAPADARAQVVVIANGSPIKPITPLGALFVFILRASLDLLLLAAVLQAWQIAARLRDQTTAFWAKQLPILDPFAERATFRPVALGLFQYPHVIPIEQPPVADFPLYERGRLTKIVQGVPTGEKAKSTVLIDPVARRGALAETANIAFLVAGDWRRYSCTGVAPCAQAVRPAFQTRSACPPEWPTRVLCARFEPPFLSAQEWRISL